MDARAASPTPNTTEIPMHPTRNDLPEKARKKLVDLLQARLADAIDLGLQAKQAHWNVKGPQFIALHELFDGVHTRVQAQVDDLAERIVQLGGSASGTLQAAHARTSLPEYPLDAVSGRAHVEALAASMTVYGKAVRAAIDAAAKLGDADTADLFTEVSRAADKDLWFVEAHLGASE
jgi:starvation-inducible DNA-binding protein